MRTQITSLTLLITVFAALNAYADEAWRNIAGTGTHFASEAIVHSAESTPNGKIQRSTEIVQLEGDLIGRVLFQPVSQIDFAKGTQVNTGHQVFSGSVLGSKPVLLHDEAFRFEVDLETGATTGEIFLMEQVAGPGVQCRLSMEGTGMTAAGDNTFVYSGKCRSQRSAG